MFRRWKEEWESLIYNFVLHHIYFRNLSYQQKGTAASLFPTNINHNPLLKR